MLAQESQTPDAGAEKVYDTAAFAAHELPRGKLESDGEGQYTQNPMKRMFAERTNWNLSENALSRALTERRASGKEIIDLTESNPTKCGFAYNEREILQALSDERVLRYEPEAKGLPLARSAVANYYAQRGVQVPSETILLTTGTSEAYSFLFRMLCNAGDELLIAQPSYPLFEFLADIQDVRLVHYPLLYDHGWQIDFHSLESAITERTRGIVVVHPNNPTGQFVKAGERAELNRICASRNLALIVDEVFLDFALDGEARASFAGNSETLTFTLSGISKVSGLPQMKAGWIVASGPGELTQEAVSRLEVIADAYLSVGMPVQAALPELLNLSAPFQRQALERVKANLGEMDRQLRSQTECEQLAAEGGWYAVLRVPVRQTDEELAIRLLCDNGVYVHPGYFFEFSSQGHLVVSLIVPEADFRRGLRLLLELIAG
jgi:alanine-synthesizing transaminase